MENALSKSFFLALFAGLIYWWARKARKGSKYILALSGFMIVMSLVALAAAIEYPFIIFLLATGIYGLMALDRQSNALMIFALLAFGQWYGIMIAYKRGSYYIGISSPIHFLVLGLFLFILAQTDIFNYYPMRSFTTTIMVIGIIYANMALWMFSTVGYHIKHQQRSERYFDGLSSQLQLMGWSMIWLASSISLGIYGVWTSRASAQRLAVVFSLLNLYTKFFEYFWYPETEVFFFIVLASSLCLLGYRMKLYFFTSKPTVSKKRKK